MHFYFLFCPLFAIVVVYVLFFSSSFFFFFFFLMGTGGDRDRSQGGV